MNIIKTITLIFLLASCTNSPSTTAPQTTGSSSSESSVADSEAKILFRDNCKSRVSTAHGAPDAEFYNEVFEYIKTSPEIVFAPNENFDIYSLIKSRVAPNGWSSMKQRRAAMGEVMMVSAAMESDYKWNEGIDTTNSSSAQNKCNEEAGAFQTSGNVLANFGGDLITSFKANCQNYMTSTTCKNFIVCSKKNHFFAMDTHARMLRKAKGYTHYGPILRGAVTNALRLGCINEIQGKL